MGLVYAFAITLLWGGHLALVLAAVDVSFSTFGTAIRTIIHVLIQGYLYTGLFITAHDAMHGQVSKNRRVNRTIGATAAFLFAGFSYRKLHRNHMLHHRYPGEVRDPDFYVRSQRFLPWLVAFFARYVTVLQIVVMAGVYNLLALVAPSSRVIAFWMVPAFLGTLQLFYFGTYRPHMLPHTDEMQPHKTRTLPKNHLWAMVSCYFFGYHYEHHSSPGTPWWRLYRLK